MYARGVPARPAEREIVGITCVNQNSFLHVPPRSLGYPVRRTQSAPPSSSSESASSQSTNDSEQLDRLLDPNNKQEYDFFESDDDDDAEGGGKKTTDKNRRLCKSKRKRMRSFKLQVERNLRQDPHFDLNNVQFPVFIESYPQLKESLLARLAAYQVAVQTGQFPTEEEPGEPSSTKKPRAKRQASRPPSGVPEAKRRAGPRVEEPASSSSYTGKPVRGKAKAKTPASPTGWPGNSAGTPAYPTGTPLNPAGGGTPAFGMPQMLGTDPRRRHIMSL